MKYWKFWSLCVIAVIVFACSSDSDSPEEDQDSFDRGAMLANWADNIIIPSYSSFNSKANNLKTAASTFTTSPSEENLQSLRIVWEDAYLSFQTVSMFEIGKAEELRYREHLNIYPTNTSEIESNISSGNFDFTPTTSFDAQGFPALDYLLNGLAETDSEIVDFYISNPNAENYKMYLNKLAENISQLTNEVLSNWNNGFRDDFVANTSSSASGAVDKLTNDYIQYFEKSLRAGKVGIPAGVFSGDPLPENVEAFYKKDISKKLLLKAITASQDFFNGKSFSGSSNGQGFKTYLDYLNTIKNGENLSGLLNEQFTSAKNKANELDNNFVDQIQTDNSKMLASYDELQRVVILLKVDMIQAMNISIDYVDSDGD